MSAERWELRHPHGTPADQRVIGIVGDESTVVAGVPYGTYEEKRRAALLVAVGGSLAEVLTELNRATVKFPTWPTDPLHALAVLGEEFGELTKAMLQKAYEPHRTSNDEIRKEAVQTAAMAIRVCESLGRYEYQRCPQHTQGIRADGRP